MPRIRTALARNAFRLILFGLALGLTLGNPAPAQVAPKSAVTEADAVAFGKSVEAAYQKGDAGAFAELINWETLVDMSTAKVDAPEAFRKGFREGLLKSKQNPNGFAGKIVGQVRGGSRYGMLRSRSRDRQKTALFRLAPPNGAGVNYMEFLLARDKDGKVRASDLYIFFSGELLSDTFHRAYIQSAAQQNRGFLAKLAGNDQDFINSFAKLGDISQNIAAGKYAEALAVCDALPESVQKDKTFMLVRIQAAQKFDEKKYTAAIERFRQLYPKDVCADILSIDGFALIKQFDKAIAAIDRLDKSVDGDGYLNVMRGAIMLLAEKPEDARKFARIAIEKAPEMIDGHWTLLTADLKLNDYPAALVTLKKLDQSFEMEFGDFTGIPDYAGFVKSPRYAQWKDYLKSKKKPEKP